MKPTKSQLTRAAEISQRCAEVAGVEVKQHSRLDRLLWVSPYPQHSCRWDVLDPRCFQAFVLGIPGKILDAAWEKFAANCPECLKDPDEPAPDGACLKWDHSPGGYLAFAEAVLAEVDRNA